MDATTPEATTRRTILVPLGGLAVLAGMVIHIVANAVVKQFPPEGAAGEQLRNYLEDEFANWGVVHGLRYLAIACIALFAGALFARTARPSSMGWSIVGLLGAAMLLVNLLITNGIETYVFFDVAAMSANDALFWALFSLTRVLFTAEVCAWAILIGGFSAAGLASRTLPKWLAALGLAHAACGIASAALIVHILADGPGAFLIDAAAFTGLAWFTCAGVYLILRGLSPR